MKVLFLAPGSPFAGAYGTEIVTYGVAAGLAAVGLDVHVAYHGRASVLEPQSLDGLWVHELGSLPNVDRQMKFSMRTPEAPGFAELLSRLKPDIVQISGITASAINRRHIEIAKVHGVKVVLWQNVPGLTCLQTGLLFEGRVPCDGEVDVARCTHCRLHVANVPRVATRVLSKIGLPVVDGMSYRFESLLAARDFTRRHAEALTRVLGEPDAIWVSARWCHDVLRRNGVPESKLHLIRLGVRLPPAAPPVAVRDYWTTSTEGRAVRMVYWGRVHRSKGIHTVLEALALRPHLRVEFAVFGDFDPTNTYCRELQAQAAGDARVKFHGRIEPEQVLPVLRTADLAVIPSRWHETGPLTVYEAQAAGLAIIGANRGGVGELCAGLAGARIFSSEDPVSLATVLDEVVGRPEVLDEMRRHVDPPRTMTEVRDEVARLYATVLNGKAH